MIIGDDNPGGIDDKSRAERCDPRRRWINATRSSLLAEKVAKELLDAIEKGTIPRADVPVVTARQVLALNDKAVSERLEKVWGKITPASKERVALMKKWKGVLTEEDIAPDELDRLAELIDKARREGR